MANELTHKDPGSELTQAEFIASDGTGHVFESQATGDILYASSSTVLSRLEKGTDGDILNLESGLPAWKALTNLITLATHTTGNFVATVADTGAGGILVAGSGSEDAAVTIQFNIHGLTTDTIASGDFIAFSDEDEANDVSNKLTVDNLMETGLPLVTEDTVAVATDYMVFLDGGATGNANKESIADFVSGIAGTNVTASSGQLSVGAAGASLGLVVALGG